MVIVANNRHKHEKTFVSSDGTGSFSRGNCFDFSEIIPPITISCGLT